MQSYKIHNNGGIPFFVNDYADNKIADVIDNETGHILHSINYVKIFIGIERMNQNMMETVWSYN